MRSEEYAVGSAGVVAGAAVLGDIILGNREKVRVAKVLARAGLRVRRRRFFMDIFQLAAVVGGVAGTGQVVASGASLGVIDTRSQPLAGPPGIFAASATRI